MSKAREKERAVKKKRRNSFRKGAAAEKERAQECRDHGLEGEGRLIRVSYGQSQADVLAWDLIIESKKYAEWASAKIMQWMAQVEGYGEQYADARYPVVVEDCTHRGIKSNPMVHLRWFNFLDICARCARAEDELARRDAEIAGMKQAVAADANNGIE